MNWRSTQQKLEALCEARLLADLPWEILTSLAERFQAYRLEPGQTPPAAMVFVVVEGALRDLPAGQLIWQKPYPVAVETCWLLLLPRLQLAELPGIAEGLL